MRRFTCNNCFGGPCTYEINGKLQLENINAVQCPVDENGIEEAEWVEVTDEEKK